MATDHGDSENVEGDTRVSGRYSSNTQANANQPHEAQAITTQGPGSPSSNTGNGTANESSASLRRRSRINADTSNTDGERRGTTAWYRRVMNTLVLIPMFCILLSAPISVIMSLKQFDSTVSIALSEKAEKNAFFFEHSFTFTTSTATAVSVTQISEYTHDQRVECHSVMLKRCLHKVGPRCSYVKCFWLGCLNSEKSRCEMEETRKCYDYSLSQCFTSKQAEYLRAYIKEDLTQFRVWLSHILLALYGGALFFFDLAVLNCSSPGRLDYEFTEEKWALVFHIFSCLLTLGGAIAIGFVLKNDGRRHCCFSVLLLSIYSSVMIGTYSLRLYWRRHHRRVSIADVEAGPENGEEGNTKRSVSTGSEHRVSDVRRRGVRRNSSNSQGSRSPHAEESVVADGSRENPNPEDPGPERRAPGNEGEPESQQGEILPVGDMYQNDWN
ncbi:hypothetical protein CJJ07_004207 [Candidozyma auris]|nr:hypothetical protein CJJ07_004207 [[Candida] auris]